MPELRTAGVRALVEDVIAHLPRPLNEHVTLAVFKAIEANPAWLNEYRILCNELRQWVVNNWIGQWTREHLGAERLNPSVGVKDQTTLIKTYSTLRFSA